MTPPRNGARFPSGAGQRGLWLAGLLLVASILFFVSAWAYRSGNAGATRDPAEPVAEQASPAPSARGSAPARYPTAGRMPEGFEADASPQALAFRTVCSRCHALPSPYLYDEAGWRGVTAKMGAQMRERGVRIPRREVDLAIEYVIRHARPRRPGPRQLTTRNSELRTTD